MRALKVINKEGTGLGGLLDQGSGGYVRRGLPAQNKGNRQVTWMTGRGLLGNELWKLGSVRQDLEKGENMIFTVSSVTVHTDQVLTVFHVWH